MLTHEFLDHLLELAQNSIEGKNEKPMERVIEYIEAQIRVIKQMRRYDRDDEVFVESKRAESLMRKLHERADHWEAKMLRESVPEHIQGHSNEIQLLWVRTFRSAHEASQSIGTANIAADDAVEKALIEGSNHA